jgi:hypothetical protein
MLWHMRYGNTELFIYLFLIVTIKLILMKILTQSVPLLAQHFAENCMSTMSYILIVYPILKRLINKIYASISEIT